jgi:hypothetical protein
VGWEEGRGEGSSGEEEAPCIVTGDRDRALDESLGGRWITLRPYRQAIRVVESGIQADNSLFQRRTGSPYDLGRGVVVHMYSQPSLRISSLGTRDWPGSAQRLRFSSAATAAAPTSPNKNLQFSRHEPIVGSLRAALRVLAIIALGPHGTGGPWNIELSRASMRNASAVAFSP